MQKQSLCFWQQTYIYQMNMSCRLCRNIHLPDRCANTGSLHHMSMLANKKHTAGKVAFRISIFR